MMGLFSKRQVNHKSMYDEMRENWRQSSESELELINQNTKLLHDLRKQDRDIVFYNRLIENKNERIAAYEKLLDEAIDHINSLKSNKDE